LIHLLGFEDRTHRFLFILDGGHIGADGSVRASPGREGRGSLVLLVTVQGLQNFSIVPSLLRIYLIGDLMVVVRVDVG
jgi:hypothetical protein